MVVVTVDTTTVTKARLVVSVYGNHLTKRELTLFYGYYCFHPDTATNPLWTSDLTQVTSLGINVLDNKVGAG